MSCWCVCTRLCLVDNSAGFWILVERCAMSLRAVDDCATREARQATAPSRLDAVLAAGMVRMSLLAVPTDAQEKRPRDDDDDEVFNDIFIQDDALLEFLVDIMPDDTLPEDLETEQDIEVSPPREHLRSGTLLPGVTPDMVPPAVGWCLIDPDSKDPPPIKDLSDATRKGSLSMDQNRYLFWYIVNPWRLYTDMREVLITLDIDKKKLDQLKKRRRFEVSAYVALPDKNWPVWFFAPVTTEPQLPFDSSASDKDDGNFDRDLTPSEKRYLFWYNVHLVELMRDMPTILDTLKMDRVLLLKKMKTQRALLQKHGVKMPWPPRGGWRFGMSERDQIRINYLRKRLQ